MNKLLCSLVMVASIMLLAASSANAQGAGDTIFEARVLEVIAEEDRASADGTANVQQNLRLIGLEGEYLDREFVFNGIGELDVLSRQRFAPGDRVMAAASVGPEGNTAFYIVDAVRTDALWLLAALFSLVLIAVGRFKGVRALLALALTFLIIILYVIPRILAGASPLFVTFFGSFLILLVIIYVTEGFKARSHLSSAAIFASLAFTILLSYVFVAFARLTGAASEEILFLSEAAGTGLNFRGLLLAGVIIGSLGVLDDVVISQVATVEQLKGADPYLGRRELFQKAYTVGVSHIASMTNTLFLAYAGASLPLLLLFVSGGSAFTSWTQAVNTELIATEIVRTLAGSIGLILSVPLATYFAAWWFGKNRDNT